MHLLACRVIFLLMAQNLLAAHYGSLRGAETDAESPQNFCANLPLDAQHEILQIFGYASCCTATSSKALNKLLLKNKPNISDTAINKHHLVRLLDDITRMENWCSAREVFSEHGQELMSDDEYHQCLKDLVTRAHESRNTPYFRFKNGEVRILSLCAGTPIRWPKQSSNMGLKGLVQDRVLWSRLLLVSSGAFCAATILHAYHEFSQFRRKESQDLEDYLQSYPTMSLRAEENMVNVGCGQRYQARQETNYTVLNNTVVLFPGNKEAANGLCQDLIKLILSVANNDSHSFTPLYPVKGLEFYTAQDLCFRRSYYNATQFMHRAWDNSSTFFSPIAWEENPHLPHKGVVVERLFIELPDAFPKAPTTLNTEILMYNKECYVDHKTQEKHKTIWDILLGIDNTQSISNITYYRGFIVMIFAGSLYYLMLASCMS